METFFWHDYETWGVNPALDRPSQFAAIRTDAELNEIGEPMMIFAKPPVDMLPHPEAVLVTGITPQYADEHGVSEAEFIAAIHQQMAQPKTCSVGFNSLRFDDEVTRYTLYRNFYDAYAREWQQGNSRWDLIDVVRLCAALRPEGIHWPEDEHGFPSFRLEALTAANGIAQVGAHDALVDVRATIDVARLIKQKQPRLYDYALTLRNKHKVLDVLALGSAKPIFHISSMFGSKNYCASVVLPLCMHPNNKNEVICFDLRSDPSEFLDLPVEDVQQRVFSSQSTLAEIAQQKGVSKLERIAIKSIHINKCPMVLAASPALLTNPLCQRLSMDWQQLEQHRVMLSENKDSWVKAQAIFRNREYEPRTDVDEMLYSGGFFSAHDKRHMLEIINSSADELAHKAFNFNDKRLYEMLFRYKGRNMPEILTNEDALKWSEFCHQRVAHHPHNNMDKLHQKCLALAEENKQDPAKLALLESVKVWAKSLQHEKVSNF